MGKKFSRLEIGKRLKLKELLDQNVAKTEIADILGVHIATVYREIQRGTVNGAYEPESAQDRYNRLSEGVGRKQIIAPNGELAAFITDQLLNKHKGITDTIEMIKSQYGISLSRATLYNAINNGDLPGVTIDKIEPHNTATVFSDGHVIIPSWFRTKFGIVDGDKMSTDVSDDGSITFRKKSE